MRSASHEAPAGPEIARASSVRIPEWTLPLIALLALVPLSVSLPFIPLWAYVIYYPLLAIAAGFLGARLVVDAFREVVLYRQQPTKSTGHE